MAAVTDPPRRLALSIRNTFNPVEAAAAAAVTPAGPAPMTAMCKEDALLIDSYRGDPGRPRPGLLRGRDAPALPDYRGITHAIAALIPPKAKLFFRNALNGCLSFSFGR